MANIGIWDGEIGGLKDCRSLFAPCLTCSVVFDLVEDSCD